MDENKKFEVVGVYDPDDLQKQVKNRCNEMIPKVRAKFTIQKWNNDKYIVSAEIPETRQEEKPCYYSSAGIQKSSYVRVGDSDERMTAFEIYNLMSYKERKEEDLRIVERESLEDLDNTLLKEYINIVKESRPNFAKFD